MKKVSKPLLSVILVIALVGLMIIPAAAADTPGKVDYVAFGDSNAAGVRGGVGEPGCELSSDFSYTNDIANLLAGEGMLGSFSKDFCTSGMTAKQLAIDTQVLNHSGTSEAQMVRDAEIATLDIGANDILDPLYDYVKTLGSVKDVDLAQATVILQKMQDILYNTDQPEQIQLNTEKILQNILNANSGIKIFVMGYYNPLPAATTLCGINLDDSTKYLNTFIKKAVDDVVADNPGSFIAYVDTMQAMAASSKALVTYDIHPTMAGYQIIAGEFWKQIEPVMTSFMVATPSKAKVFIDGKSVNFEAYNINGYNYFKLRDLAMALNGSPKQFEVTYDSYYKAIRVTTKTPYTPVGGELAISGSTDPVTPVLSISRVYIDGVIVAMKAYNIGGYNYIKLRDVGAAINFGVDWSDTAGTISIDTSKGYK